jgi:hypothetical protein
MLCHVTNIAVKSFLGHPKVIILFWSLGPVLSQLHMNLLSKKTFHLQILLYLYYHLLCELVKYIRFVLHGLMFVI